MFCWYYKWKISKLADESDSLLTGEVSEHIKHCPKCRSYYRLCRQMDTALSPEQTITRQTIQQVQQAVTEEIYSTPQNKRRNYRYANYLAAAVILLLSIPAAVFWVVSRDLTQMLEKERYAVGGLNRLSEMVKDQWLDSDSKPSVAATENYLVIPYRNEVRQITQNGKQAARFVWACLDPGLQIPEDTSEPQQDPYEIAQMR